MSSNPTSIPSIQPPRSSMAFNTQREADRVAKIDTITKIAYVTMALVAAAGAGTFLAGGLFLHQVSLLKTGLYLMGGAIVGAAINAILFRPLDADLERLKWFIEFQRQDRLHTRWLATQLIAPTNRIS